MADGALPPVQDAEVPVDVQPGRVVLLMAEAEEAVVAARGPDRPPAEGPGAGVRLGDVLAAPGGHVLPQVADQQAAHLKDLPRVPLDLITDKKMYVHTSDMMMMTQHTRMRKQTDG